MTTDNLSAQKLLTIPVGTDFNGLVQPGTYQQLWYDATAQNTPTGGNACQLAVSRIAENVILQTCTVWRGELVYETYQRIREAETWTAWSKLLSANDVQRAWLTDYAEAPVTANSNHNTIPIPEHPGYRCVAAFSPCTKGWVGAPYINTKASEYQYGTVMIWHSRVSDDVSSLSVGCNFLFFKTGDVAK